MIDKKEIDQLFDRLSSRYDTFCPIFSFGIDHWWRFYLLSKIKKGHFKRFLDIACGTGAIICRVAKQSKKDQSSLFGLDLSEEMLAMAKIKSPTVNFIHGDALHMPFESDSFDATANAFGLRNFHDYRLGLKENHRVLVQGGVAFFLELSLPKNLVIRSAYRLYLHYIIPWLGHFFVNDPSAWRYLGKSIEQFVSEVDLHKELQDAGFQDVSSTSLTFGIAKLYQARK